MSRERGPDQGSEPTVEPSPVRRAQSAPPDRWADVVVPGELPDEMTAVRIHRYGAPPEVERLALPEPGEGELLVKIAASIVSHFDLTVAAGDFVVRPELPYTPGIEGSGRVVRVGEGVDPSAVAIGAPVRLHGGGLGAARPGTWADYAVVPATAAHGVPRALAPDIAAACGSVALTAWVALFEVGSFIRGERLGVSGATGAVGSLVVQLALRHGAAGVVAFLRSKASEQRLVPGVDAVVDPADAGASVDLLVDTVGGALLPSRVATVKPGGRAVLVGYTAGEEVRLTVPDLLARDVSLLPVNMMRRRQPEELASDLVAQFATGELHVGTNVFQAKDFPAAVTELWEGRSVGRTVVVW
ncbi:MAG: quinone oxidoreductase family protein [Nitrososphaerales archaeon]